MVAAMPKPMTIAGQIERLIEGLEGNAICDDCVTDRLNLSVRSQANVVTRELGNHEAFDRGKACCGLCDSVKTVIRHKVI